MILKQALLVFVLLFTESRYSILHKGGAFLQKTQDFTSIFSSSKMAPEWRCLLLRTDISYEKFEFEGSFDKGFLFSFETLTFFLIIEKYQKTCGFETHYS